ncbi:hypothetical protein [Spiroplasma endosymbiont of Labia minor]|uniref:hypothetical protein n=1 Tax=Spiroplasma endosymbiont of Labia minor TaxID=3066305 RepID=UPI0030D5D592
MKKLLSVLAAFTLGSSATSVVACGTSYDKHADDGSSILANVTIDGSTVSITSTDALKEMINSSGPENRNKLMLQFLKLMAASFLLNIDNENVPEENGYINSNWKQNLKDDLDQLKSDIDYEIQNEKDQYKEDNGKKWSDKWYEMLKNKYPGIDDHNTLDRKYWQEKFIDGTDNNSLQVLQNNLLSRYQQNITWRTIAQIQASELTAMKNSYKDNETFDKFVETSKEKALTLLNSARIKADDTIKTDVTSADLQTTFGTDVNLWSSKIINDAPQDVTQYSKGSNATGMISNSQRFFLNHYFENEKPLSVSTIKFAFSDGGKWTDGIGAGDFTANNTNPAIANDIVSVMKTVSNGDAGLKAWDQMLSAGSTTAFTENGNGTVAANSTLLTLDDTSTYDDLTRATVYAYINNAATGQTLTNINSIDEVVNPINRSTNTNMFGVVNDNGIIAFINDSGLNLVRIDNYAQIAAKNTTDLTANKDNSISKEMSELNMFNNFKNLSDTEKVAVMQGSGISDDGSVTYSGLNSQFTDNSYLKFLVNNSIVSSLSESIEKFDVIKSLNSYISVAEPSTETGVYVWWTAYYDYFKQIMNITNDKDFVETFLKFNDMPSDLGNGENWSLEDWFINHVVSASAAVKSNPGQTFVEKYNSYVEDTNNFEPGKPNGLVDISDMSPILEPGDFANTETGGNTKSSINSIWEFIDAKSLTKLEIFNISFNVDLIGGKL